METEGIKYAGSKLKILPYIRSIAGELGIRTVLDGFSGSTRVSQMFSQCGYDVISNDISVWSETFATAYLLHDRPIGHYAEIISHLNDVDGRYGWFSEHYGGSPESGGKKPFQLKNTMKLDAVREEIDRMGLAGTDRAVALTSLILALDSVDNTLGHYCAYLNGWSPRSSHDMILKVPRLCPHSGRNSVFRKDIFDLVKDVEADLAYLEQATDARGRRLTVHKLPIPDHPILCSADDCAAYDFAPGEDVREPGERLAASYVNFYFTNGAVLVPQFGGENAASDARACAILQAVCPGRRVVGLPARDILQGGGNIHCITQQIPL